MEPGVAGAAGYMSRPPGPAVSARYRLETACLVLNWMSFDNRSRRWIRRTCRAYLCRDSFSTVPANCWPVSKNLHVSRACGTGGSDCAHLTVAWHQSTSTSTAKIARFAYRVHLGYISPLPGAGPRVRRWRSALDDFLVECLVAEFVGENMAKKVGDENRRIRL